MSAPIHEHRAGVVRLHPLVSPSSYSGASARSLRLVCAGRDGARSKARATLRKKFFTSRSFIVDGNNKASRVSNMQTENQQPEKATDSQNVSILNKAYLLSELVEGDAPTPLFWALWKADKEAVKGAGLFVGKMAGKFVVQRGVRVNSYKVTHDGGDVNPGPSWAREGVELPTQKCADDRIAQCLLPRFVVSFPGCYNSKNKQYSSEVCYSRAEAEKFISEQTERLRDKAVISERPSPYKAEKLAIVELHHFEAPQFGTPEERAARRVERAEYDEAMQEERRNMDYRADRNEPTFKENIALNEKMLEAQEAAERKLEQ